MMRKLARLLGAALAILCLAEIIDLAWLGYVRATITTTASSVTALGNGATQVFNFSFVAGQASYLQVTFTAANGTATLLAPSQYTVAINSAAPGAVWGIGGSVTYPTIASGNPPIATGTTLTIARAVPLIQAVSSNQGQLFPLAVEQALDLLDMQVQQTAALFGRALVQPVSDTCSFSALPGQAQRANAVLGFDGSGCGPIAVSTAPAGVISSAMQPVVNAATLAAGRIAFGLASMATEAINSGALGGNSLEDDGAGNARVASRTVGDAANQAVTCNYHFTQHIATGPITYTLPRANTCFNGFGFWVFAVPTGGAVTFAPNANDNFVGLASGVSTAIAPGNWAWVSTNAASSATWYLAPAVKEPTVTVIASGVTNYVTPAGARQLRVRAVGGGGGGSGNGSGSTNGGSGGQTSFGSFAAGAGLGGGGGGFGGAGGTASGGYLNQSGQAGGNAANLAAAIAGSLGGGNCMGPGGVGGEAASGAGRAAVANTGAGGGGAGGSGGVGAGAGGGGGACLDGIINNPAATIAYAIGTGGAAGGAGSGGNAGGAGSAGVVIVQEFYN